LAICAATARGEWNEGSIMEPSSFLEVASDYGNAEESSERDEAQGVRSAVTEKYQGKR